MNAISTRTVRLHEYGEPLSVLVEERDDVPDPGPGQVRVLVEATGLNPADWEICRGFMGGLLPRGIGFDVAGTVDAVGEGVADVALGDSVFGTADIAGQTTGGVADVAILREWARMPEGLAPTQAATLPMVVKTADWTLGALGVQHVRTVLIHGAGSMVGFAAVQAATALGVRVIATAGPTYAADLEGFGATVMSYGAGMVERIREVAADPIDLVIDTAPPTPGTIADLLRLVDDPSNVVTISNHAEARESGARVNIDLLPGVADRLTPPRLVFERYAARVVDGTFRLPIARVLPLDAWREAVELSTSRHSRGKVVLVP